MIMTEIIEHSESPIVTETEQDPMQTLINLHACRDMYMYIHIHAYTHTCNMYMYVRKYVC